MRIVHLIDYFQAPLGYQESSLALSHQQAGHRVVVVTSDRYYPFAGYEKVYYRLLGPRIVGTGKRREQGINVVRLPSWELSRTPVIFLRYLKQTLNSIRPELVFCHGVYSALSVMAALYKNSFRYRLVYDSHASGFNTDFNSHPFKKSYHFIFRLFSPLIFNRADKIFAVGESEKEFLLNDFNLPRHRVEILRVGIDSRIYSFNPLSRLGIRKNLGIKESDTVLVFSGKINPGKDLKVLLRALNKISDPGFILMIIGGGDSSYTGELKKMDISPVRIIWLDFVNRNKLVSYFSAADLAVWPGDASIGMLQALSCGLPLIIPEWFGSGYLKKQGIAVTFPRGNFQLLAEIINKLSKNYDLRRKISEKAKNYIKNELSWKKIAEKSLILPKN